MFSLLEHQGAEPQNSAYSFITRIELLGYPALSNSEAQRTIEVLETMQYLPMTSAIENMAIQIRRQHGLKIPDAIIAATAIVSDLALITLDRQLANRMTEILGQG